MADSNDGDSSEDRLIAENFRIWEKNIPKFYDRIFTHDLEWPSLTVEWIPDYEEPSDMDYSVQTLILGAHATESNDNYLLLNEVRLPLDEEEDEEENDQEEGNPPIGSDNTQLPGGGKQLEMQTIKKIRVNGEVSRARYMPRNSNIIATKTVNAEVYVFDYSRHPSDPPADSPCNPDLTLRGHEYMDRNAEGFGLCWSPLQRGRLLSCSEDGRICLWDIRVTPNSRGVDSLITFKIGRGETVMKDVAWSFHDEFKFGSVGFDSYLHVWDLRLPSVVKPAKSVRAHDGGTINCVAFNPFNGSLVATAGADYNVKLFDLRMTAQPLHTLQVHVDEVVQLAWYPKRQTILASSGMDRRVVIWDLSRIGDMTEEEAKLRKPEFVFAHAGHTDRVRDMSWNMCDDRAMATVAQNDIIQVWQVAKHIYDVPRYDLPESDQDSNDVVISD